MSLNNEKTCCEISEDKIAFCEKTAGLRRGKFSDSNSACLKVLKPGLHDSHFGHGTLKFWHADPSFWARHS